MNTKTNNEYVQRLMDFALEASRNAYTPYSGLHVGAALITEEGNMFTGCNVENASYGISICAERNAIFAAVNAEGPGMKIVAIAVTSTPAMALSPCGACRQAIAEFVNPKEEGTTISFNSGDGIVTQNLDSLLPEVFRFEK